MKNTIFALIVATGLASFAGFAKAEVIYTFDYSFNDYRGAVTGTVLGTVTSGILTPTSVTAQTGGSSFSISTSDPYSSATGGFNVIPEVISHYSIYGADYITDITNETGEYWTRIWFNYSAGMNAGLNSFSSDFNGNNLNVANDWGFTGVTYSAVTSSATSGIYTFDYSFNDYRGAVTGTVLGTIASGILTPTSVTAQTGGSSFSISTSDPYSSATGGFNVIPEVISYSIYGADYITDITNETGEYWTRIWLNYSAGMNAGLNSFSSDFNGNNLNVANDWGFTGVTYGAVTVYQDPAAIPEPSTYSLIGLGALAIAIAKRKRTLAA